jgi:hypothetical protein
MAMDEYLLANYTSYILACTEHAPEVDPTPYTPSPIYTIIFEFGIAVIK